MSNKYAVTSHAPDGLRFLLGFARWNLEEVGRRGSESPTAFPRRHLSKPRSHLGNAPIARGCEELQYAAHNDRGLCIFLFVVCRKSNESLERCRLVKNLLRKVAELRIVAERLYFLEGHQADRDVQQGRTLLDNTLCIYRARCLPLLNFFMIATEKYLRHMIFFALP